jgi:hypothetical protein
MAYGGIEMRITRPGYWMEIDKKTRTARIWSFGGGRVVAVIDLLNRKVVWSEEEIEVQILLEDIHIKLKKRGPTATSAFAAGFSS